MKIYRDNITMYDANLLQLSKVLKRISFLRLFIFVLSSIILVYLISNHLVQPLLIAFPVLIFCFGAAIKYHSKIAFLKKHTALLKDINESEILRAECKLEGFDTGDDFINQNHPYTSDLDIFGQHSIFQLLNRTTTESGKILLSEWLSEPAPNPEILDRQEAIKELSGKLEWRQDFQASGMHFHSKRSDYYKLLEWVEKPVVLLNAQLTYRLVTIISPILFILSLYFFFDNLNAPNWFVYLTPVVLVFMINYMILKRLDSLAENIVETSSRNLNTLRGYRTLINKIENGNFKSKKLCELQSILTSGEYSAYHEINRLCSILDFSHQRSIKGEPLGGNQFYPLFNIFLLLDIHLIIGTEKWKLKNKAFLKQWSKIVSEFEVINSLAGFCYSNPSYTFPEITTKDNHLHFESLGHPLINPDERVCNDFYSERQSDIVLVTGSNMGGKSTFLRTVGVNIVLSLAGAPCCARYGQVSNLTLFTSMRTQDNLQKGVSSFYAELNRMEKLLKLIENSQNVYFLLDEIFKGTNSKDRHRGGFSLINQISKLKTSGIIATHDIELAKILGNKMLVTNYSFNSEIEGDSMIFSYKLHPGICNDFNASALMEKSGIEIISDISKSETE